MRSQLASGDASTKAACPSASENRSAEEAPTVGQAADAGRPPSQPRPPSLHEDGDERWGASDGDSEKYDGLEAGRLFKEIQDLEAKLREEVAAWVELENLLARA